MPNQRSRFSNTRAINLRVSAPHTYGSHLWWWIVVPFLGLVSISCAPEDVEEAPPPSEPALLEPESVELRSIAQALAAALEEDQIRLQLFDDLQHSQFPQSGLPLDKYIVQQNDLYARLQTIIRAEADLELDAVLGTVSGYWLVVPSAHDRQHWSGDEDAIVVPVEYESHGESDANTLGFLIGGDTVAVPLFGRPEEVVIALVPLNTSSTADTIRALGAAAQDFDLQRFRATDPQRRAIPERDANSGTEDQLDLLRTRPAGNDNATRAFQVLEQHQLSPASLSIPNEATVGSCWIDERSDTVDADQDGLRDTCEYAIAKAAHPRLITDRDTAANRREEYWAVRAEGQSAVYVFYAIAYHRDTKTPKHAGDSEFVIVELQRTQEDKLVPKQITLSAHYKAFWSFDRSDSVAATAIASQGRWHPLVWVSNGKHANYASQEACTTPPLKVITYHLPLFEDDCSGRRDTVDVRVLRGANLGGGGLPLANCVGSRELETENVECLWTVHGRFRGWQKTKPGERTSTGYGVPLQDFSFYPTREQPVK